MFSTGLQGTDFFLVLLSAALVNNVVTTQFLGLCPFLGVSARMDSALGLGAATSLVLLVSVAIAFGLDTLILTPLDAIYLRTIAFIFSIACAVQSMDIVTRAVSPRLHRVLGIYLPLITTNCAVLGVALLAVRDTESFLSAMLYASGGAAGFVLVLVLFTSIRERTEGNHIPPLMRGTPIALVTAGLIALAFMGFGGMGGAS